MLPVVIILPMLPEVTEQNDLAPATVTTPPAVKDSRARLCQAHRRVPRETLLPVVVVARTLDLKRTGPRKRFPAVPVLHPDHHDPGDPDSRRYFADTIPPNPPGGITAPTNALRPVASVNGSRDPDGQARPAPGERHREDMKPGEERPAGTRRTAKPPYSYLFGWVGWGSFSLIEGRHRPVSTERYIHSLSMR